MFRANLRFSVYERPTHFDHFEIATTVDAPRSAPGEMSVWEHLFVEFIKEAAPDYHGALPDPTTISMPPRQNFTGVEMTGTPYFDRRNTYWSWVAIRQTLIEARWLLAQARAYKAVEPLKSDFDSGNRLLYTIHLDKMNRFDLAVYKLAKVEDQFLRLLFENLGASLVAVDFTRQNWPALITRDRIRKGLRLHPSRIQNLPCRARVLHRIRRILRKDLRNASLEALSDSEYRELMRIFNAFWNPNCVREFYEYRHKLTHRNNPSVDYPDFYVEFEERVEHPFVNARGERGISYYMGVGRTAPEYDFLSLFSTTAQTMRHWIGLLRDLQAIPRFVR